MFITIISINISKNLQILVFTTFAYLFPGMISKIFEAPPSGFYQIKTNRRSCDGGENHTGPKDEPTALNKRKLSDKTRARFRHLSVQTAVTWRGRGALQTKQAVLSKAGLAGH
jgi:hypothetical protein